MFTIKSGVGCYLIEFLSRLGIDWCLFSFVFLHQERENSFVYLAYINLVWLLNLNLNEFCQQKNSFVKILYLDST